MCSVVGGQQQPQLLQLAQDHKAQVAKASADFLSCRRTFESLVFFVRLGFHVSHYNTKTAFSNIFALEGVFKKFSFKKASRCGKCVLDAVKNLGGQKWSLDDGKNL